MLILDSTTRKLEVVLAGAITTNQLPCVASWVDIQTSAFTPGTTVVNTNSTTAVTLVAAPAASTERQLKFVSIYNADTVAATVTVRYNDNGTTYKILVITLQIGDTLNFTDSDGWTVISSNGQIRTGFASRVNYTATPANPTGTTSTAGVMMGLAGSITPASSGIILFVCFGNGKNTTATAGDGTIGDLRYGTGGAPANGGAVTGTLIGNIFRTINERASADAVPFACGGLVTGLTVGTTYWIDMAIAAVSAGTATITDLSIFAFEL